ncbi:DUF4174 domain-containing protein [Shimia biformata]|uniref:DUF4174 domain-containing protein n=1 Tax=Shimia biformata TaxID=1294299 RepID=UPI00194FDA03|nr:DUF4174 domain-containing protein [Shimia biformata]
MLKKLCLMIALAATPVFATDAVPVSPVDAWQEDHTTRFTAGDVVLDDFKWVARPVVVFADTAADPRFVQQMDLLSERPGDLAERDVVIITDTDGAHMSDLRRKLRPRGFMLVLMGKDGIVYLRKPQPWSVREISRSIDKMPLRQQEERDRR